MKLFYKKQIKFKVTNIFNFASEDSGIGHNELMTADGRCGCPVIIPAASEQLHRVLQDLVVKERRAGVDPQPTFDKQAEHGSLREPFEKITNASIAVRFRENGSLKNEKNIFLLNNLLFSYF